MFNKEKEEIKALVQEGKGSFAISVNVIALLVGFSTGALSSAIIFGLVSRR